MKQENNRKKEAFGEKFLLPDVEETDFLSAVDDLLPFDEESCPIQIETEE